MLRYHRDLKAPAPYGFRRAFISFSPFLHPHPPHGAFLQLGIVLVLGFDITEHVCETGAAVQVTEKVGFEVEHFQVDIHLIGHALLLVCRLLHPYATFYNRQAAISLLEVLPINSSMTDFSVSCYADNIILHPSYRAAITFQSTICQSAAR